MCSLRSGEAPNMYKTQAESQTRLWNESRGYERMDRGMNRGKEVEMNGMTDVHAGAGMASLSFCAHAQTDADMEDMTDRGECGFRCRWRHLCCFSPEWFLRRRWGRSLPLRSASSPASSRRLYPPRWCTAPEKRDDANMLESGFKPDDGAKSSEDFCVAFPGRNFIWYLSLHD